MNKPTTIEDVFEKDPILKDWLRQKDWRPKTIVMIPSILKSAEVYIDFLKEFDSRDAKELRNELINLKQNFPQIPPRTISSHNLEKII